MQEACSVAIGLQWGDEGKGKIIDWLAKDAAHVARFQGGHNAGHTLVVDGRELVLHLVPSGILQANTHCYIGQGVALSLPALIAEITKLKEFGCELAGRLTVSPDCTLILPWHQELDVAREGSAGKIGTTKRGIGPAHEDKIGRRGIRLRHVLADDFRERLSEVAARINCELEHLHGASPIDSDQVATELSTQAQQLSEFVGNVTAQLTKAFHAEEKILLEASQGTLLDIEQGSYPFVTSAGCTAAAVAPGLGVHLNPQVLGIAKCYTTRVGLGSFPTEIKDTALADKLTQLGGEFGATTARQRRVGWLDLPALRHALAVNGCEYIALTKLDILGQLDEIKVCTQYQEGPWVPDDASLAKLTPVYTSLPGWGDLAQVSECDDLPTTCRDYLDLIREHTGARIRILSHGKGRHDTLLYA